MSVKWTYGVTTVPARLNDLLPRTLESLAVAGFHEPRLFIDGEKSSSPYDKFKLQVTIRNTPVRAFGNWWLALVELFVREPTAQRFAIFQDDMVCCRNLKKYLDTHLFPEHGYWNLYTFPENQAICNHKRIQGWFESDQLGKGAVALVFSLAGVQKLLAHENLVTRPTDPRRGWKAIDGGVATVHQKLGWKEYCHNPSLVQHTGKLSTVENRQHPLSPSFPGEDFDAMTLPLGRAIFPKLNDLPEECMTNEEWEAEKKALETAIADDAARLTLCPMNMKAHYQRLISKYEMNLKNHLAKDPSRQQTYRRWRIGDKVEQALKTVGITSERVEAFIGAPCGCEERKKKLNQLGAWAARILDGKMDKAVEHLDTILNEERT